MDSISPIPPDPEHCEAHMSLKKADIIQAVSEANGFSKSQATDAVETLIEIIKGTLASGEDVLVTGFGKFCVNKKSERIGRNPATGESLMLSARRVVSFKCSGLLRERMNTRIRKSKNRK